MNPRTAAGASNGLAGHVEDLTHNAPQTQPELDPIDIFMPWAKPDEKPKLRRLRNAHFAAISRAKRSRHGNARPLWWGAALMAEDRMSARLGAGDLQEAIEQVSRLFIVANYVERSEAPDER